MSKFSFSIYSVLSQSSLHPIQFLAMALPGFLPPVCLHLSAAIQEVLKPASTKVDFIILSLA